MSLLLLLSFAIGLTGGVLSVGHRVNGWLMAGIVIAMILASFALFISKIDPDITDIRGVPLLTGWTWFALCGIIFSVSLGIGTLLAAIVAQLKSFKSKGQRS